MQKRKQSRFDITEWMPGSSPGMTKEEMVLSAPPSFGPYRNDVESCSR